MTRWLYNSDGDPIAFIQNDNVFSAKGEFVGKLNSDQEVWNGEYVGELFAGDRLINNTTKLFQTRRLPGLPGLPGFSGEPSYKGPILIPSGFIDINFDWYKRLHLGMNRASPENLLSRLLLLVIS